MKIVNPLTRLAQDRSPVLVAAAHERHPAAETALPIHLGPPSRLTFAWYHPPAARTARSAGVVLCNTLGNESLRAYGTLRHLAEALATAGFAVLRFDYHGTGDSGGVESDPDRVASWLADIDLAVEELRARSGVQTVGLVGLRLGATLALQAAAHRGDVESVVAWDPYYNGREFVTDITRMHKGLAMLERQAYSLKRPKGRELDGIEALGFFLGRQTVAEIDSLDLLSTRARPCRCVLVVGSAETQKIKGAALIQRLRELGAEAEYRVLPEAMNRNLRVVSAEDHAKIAAEICAWVRGHLVAAPTAAAAPAQRRAPVQEVVGQQPEMLEQPVRFGEREELFGVVTLPRNEGPTRSRPAIVLVNAGPGTRIGPHRQYVRMARAWADLGFVVLRMDLLGSGDSAAAGTVENEPYPREAIRDLQAAMGMLGERYGSSRFVLAGICSGADIAFCGAIADTRVVGALVLNPRTFMLGNIADLEERVRAHHLGRTVTARRNWRLLLRGEAGFAGTLSRIRQVSRTVATRLEHKVQELLGRVEPQSRAVDVPGHLERLLRRGVDLLLVVGRRDVGIMYVEMFHEQRLRALEANPGFRRVNFEGIDHLFTLLYAQELLLDCVTDHLRRRYGGP